MSTLEQISENLIKGKAKEVKELVEKAVKENINVADILNKGLLAGMSNIGRVGGNQSDFACSRA